MGKLIDKTMYNSKILLYKNLSVFSDGSIIINAKTISLKVKKKCSFNEKDHKIFLKTLKNSRLIKKKVTYRNKIF